MIKKTDLGMIQFTITQQENGQWYGRANIDDGHGNEIDCLQGTPELAWLWLMKQYLELQ